MKPVNPTRDDRTRSTNEAERTRAIRLVILFAISFVLSNVVLAVVIDRDRGLGLDELVALIGALVVASAVELGIRRRQRRRP